MTEYSIKKIHDKLCDLFPDDKEKCEKNINNSKLKIMFYISVIIIGVIVLKKGPAIINEIVGTIVKGLGNLIGLPLIAYGTVSLLNV